MDPKYTPAAKLADIHLRPDPGTDGALAHFFGNYLIQHGKTDEEYIAAYVHGFPEYKRYVRKFTLEKTAQTFTDNADTSAWYYYEIVEATNDHQTAGKRPDENWATNKVDITYDKDKYETPGV